MLKDEEKRAFLAFFCMLVFWLPGLGAFARSVSTGGVLRQDADEHEGSWHHGFAERGFILCLLTPALSSKGGEGAGTASCGLCTRFGRDLADGWK
jgi:hypothetical protein